MTHDSIHSPSHYAEGRIYEPIAVIEDWDLNYRLGNCVKYVSRAGRKQNALEDLKKARWYLDREIDQLELAEAPRTSYEDVLTYYGQTQDEEEAWPTQAAQYVPFDATQDAISFDTTEDDWNDFWSGWDESAGPTEVWLSDAEIENVLAKKDLDKFERNEIVSVVDKRGFALGIKKDGSTCILKDGRCLLQGENDFDRSELWSV